MVLLFWNSNKKTIGSHWDHIKWFIILQINCKHGDKINNLVHLLKSILAGLVSKIQAMRSDQDIVKIFEQIMKISENFSLAYCQIYVNNFISLLVSEVTFSFFFLTQFNDFPILSSEFMTHVYYIESGGHYCVI